ncbi:Hypothetical Protein SLY_0259 [Strawberry lethal yellows phytoplasma (CPA) str. NZSb11]|uniref:Uncharacterized protein n=1 Tax=Strawberry lethal yellows phytoplasma (CPA) str. NZSb11 TaxID=980422 RepID=R4RLG6_PHYAS|nr:Hypothetical Protein SLY_0259 [Strawberry lethal yellows phytoplasma (CPA) str. NZSb11]
MIHFFKLNLPCFSDYFLNIYNKKPHNNVIQYY